MTSPHGSDFIFASDLSPHGVSARLAWARGVFADPTVPAESVELRHYFDGTISPIQLQRAVCGDARLRAGSIASMLLADRRDGLAKRLAALQTAETKARRDAVSARVRLEAVQKINATEPNPALRYSDISLERMNGDIVRAERAASQLAAASPNAAVVAELLQLSVAEGPEAEFAMRAFGLAWKGRIRLRAWQQARDPADLPRLPFGATEGAAAFSVPNSVLIPLEGGPGVPALVLLDRVATLYSLDLLWLAVDLARAAAEEDPDAWFPHLALPRVIVELCHVLARELPTARPGLLVDASDSSRIWLLAEDAREWQPVADPPSPRRVLRVAAESARLVADTPALFEAEDLDGLVQLLTPADGPTDPRPYLTVGLTDPVRKDTNHLGERPLAESTWALVDGLARLDPDLDAALGGASRASDALWQMALLAHPALPQRTDSERGRLLSRLWRSMGRARPVSLLGTRYKSELSRLLAAAGEATPDRPFFYSIAPTANLIAASQGGESEPDILTGTVIADRVRLVEAVNLTWRFVSGIIGAVHGAASREELEGLARTAKDRFAPHESDLRLRLHQSWLASDREVWSLLRGRAPVLWDFWVSVLAGDDWVASSAASGSETVLAHLLRIYGDLVRLMTVVEVWSPSGAERLDAGAEPASHALLATLRRLERVGAETQWTALRSAYEPVYAYFDDTAVFDPWAAFVRGMTADISTDLGALEGLGGAERQRALLTSLLARLAGVCATERVPNGALSGRAPRTAEAPVPRPTGPLIGASPPPPLSEHDATAFFGFYVDLLEAGLEDTVVFLKALALLRAEETRKTIHDLARLRGPIAQLLPGPTDRAALLCYPSTPRRVLRLLFESEAARRSEAARTGAERAREYLARAAEAHDELSNALEGFGPLLDADKAVLDAWLATGSGTRRACFALVVFANRTFMTLHELDAPAPDALGKVCAAVELRLRSFRTIGSVEPFPVAGGYISAEKGKLMVTGGHPTFDPAFAEAGQAASDSLLAHFAAARARAVRQTLSGAGLACLVRG